MNFTARRFLRNAAVAHNESCIRKWRVGGTYDDPRVIELYEDGSTIASVLGDLGRDRDFGDLATRGRAETVQDEPTDQKDRTAEADERSEP